MHISSVHETVGVDLLPTSVNYCSATATSTSVLLILCFSHTVFNSNEEQPFGLRCSIMASRAARAIHHAGCDSWMLRTRDRVTCKQRHLAVRGKEGWYDVLCEDSRIKLVDLRVSVCVW